MTEQEKAISFLNQLLESDNTFLHHDFWSNEKTDAGVNERTVTSALLLIKMN